MKIGEIELLQRSYSAVYTTPEVAREFLRDFPDWVIIQPVSDMLRFSSLEMELDKGEASAIALSYEVEDAVLVLDDMRARKVELFRPLSHFWKRYGRPIFGFQKACLLKH